MLDVLGWAVLVVPAGTGTVLACRAVKRRRVRRQPERVLVNSVGVPQSCQRCVFERVCWW